MVDTLSTPGSSPSPESILKPQGPSVDASRIIRHSLLYDAKQVSRAATKDKAAKERVDAMGLTVEQKRNLDWISTLVDLPEGPAYKKAIDLQANSDGSDSDRDTYIRLWDEPDPSEPKKTITQAEPSQKGAEPDPSEPKKTITQAEPSLKGAEMPVGSSNYRITHIVGRADGQFHCKMTINGKVELKAVPEHIIMTSFICAKSESLRARMGTAQRKVFDAYLTQLKKPGEPVTFDTQAIKEAAQSSGQITTDSILQFLDRKYQKKPIPLEPPDDASDEDRASFENEKIDIEAFNKLMDLKTQKLRGLLGDHSVASGEDLIELMKIHGPEAMQESKQALGDLKNSEAHLRAMYAQLRGTTEEANIEKELEGIRDEISAMEKALEAYADPKAAASVLLMAQNGDFPPAVGESLNYFLAQGQMDKAFLASIDAQIQSLPDDSAEKAKLERRKQIAMMAGGGGLLLLIMLITQGMSSGR